MTKELAETTQQSEASEVGVAKDERIAISRNPQDRSLEMNTSAASRFAHQNSSLPSTDGVGEDEPKRSLLYHDYKNNKQLKERPKYREVNLRVHKISENQALDRLVNIYANSPAPSIKRKNDNSLLLDLKKLERPKDRRFESPQVKLPKI